MSGLAAERPSSPQSSQSPQSPQSPQSTQSPRLTLIGRAGCHLCDDAREIVATVAADAGVDWVEQDVDGDPGMAEEYGDRVPVLLLDGREHAYWHVDEGRLRAALTGQRSW